MMIIRQWLGGMGCWPWCDECPEVEGNTVQHRWLFLFHSSALGDME